jgi:hypothetical protein
MEPDAFWCERGSSFKNCKLGRLRSFGHPADGPQDDNYSKMEQTENEKAPILREPFLLTRVAMHQN